MNKRVYLIILLLTCNIVCDAQNLIPNWSFEDTISCPVNIAQINQSAGWTNYNGSPDYFHVCSSGLVSIPNNIFGSQLPRYGNAYAGFLTYVKWQANFREIIGINLIQPLIIGQKYYVTFFVSQAYSLLHYTTGITNKIGAKFSTVAFSVPFNQMPIDNFAHVYSDSIVDDTLNWVRINGSFIADSAYQFMAIGNFFDDSSTTNIWHDSTSSQAYYYLEDICVSTDSLTCYSTVGLNEVKNKKEFILFPNPFSDKINITGNGNELNEICLYEVTGKKLLVQLFENSISINTAQLAKGIYLYEVRRKNEVIQKGKIVKD